MQSKMRRRSVDIKWDFASERMADRFHATPHWKCFMIDSLWFIKRRWDRTIRQVLILFLNSFCKNFFPLQPAQRWAKRMNGKWWGCYAQWCENQSLFKIKHILRILNDHRFDRSKEIIPCSFLPSKPINSIYKRKISIFTVNSLKCSNSHKPRNPFAIAFVA